MREIHYRCDLCNEFIDPEIPGDIRNKHRNGFGLTWSYKSPTGADLPEKRIVLIDVNASEASSHVCDRCVRAVVVAIKHFDES